LGIQVLGMENGKWKIVTVFSLLLLLFDWLDLQTASEDDSIGEVLGLRNALD